MKIAITGGIGSGKSTACSLIKQMGYSVFDADAVARSLSDDCNYVNQVLSVFPTAKTSAGKIDRKALAEIVFQNEEALRQLNDITHPIVMQKLFFQMQEAEGQENAIVFAEIPLLFEGKYENLFDGVFVLMRKESDRIAATCKRDGLTPQQVANRIKNQIDYSKKDLSAYTIIENDGNLSILHRRLAESIENLHSKK